MDPGTLIQVATLVGGMGGGFIAGRRGVARQTVELLQIQAETLTNQNNTQATKITALESKVEVLEGLVTQRAAVAEVKEVVDRIAAKVGA